MPPNELRSNHVIHCINSFSVCQQIFSIFFKLFQPFTSANNYMILHITNDVNKNFKNFSDKIFLTFLKRCVIRIYARIHASHAHLYTHTRTYTLSFPVFQSFFFSLFPFLFPFLLKPPKNVRYCVSFLFPSQYPSFSLERNHERFFAVLNDFTNSFKTFPH